MRQNGARLPSEDDDCVTGWHDASSLPGDHMDGGKTFIELRDRLLREGTSPAGAAAAFQWPALTHFNWAIDYFDRIGADNERVGLRVVDDLGRDEAWSFAALVRRSNRVANLLASAGVKRGDRVLVMLGNVAALWETLLAAIKLGATVVPATPLLRRVDLEDRFERGRVRAVVADLGMVSLFEGLSGAPIRICVGGAAYGWLPFESCEGMSDRFDAPAPTPAESLMLLYFTSGTTAKPKLV